MIKIGIVGSPFYEIKERPLDTLVGIRVRTWALFSLLPYYGFEPYLYVDPDACVDDAILSEFGGRFIRSEEEFLRRSEGGDFAFTIFCSTKLQALLNWHPWLQMIRNAKILGAFCYDNNLELSPTILPQMIGTTFTTPLQKRKWDQRQTGVPSFLITTGQSEQPATATVSSGDAVFIGELRSLQALITLCEIADLLPHRKFYLVASRIIEQSNSNHVYLDFSALSDSQRQIALRDHLLGLGRRCPENLIYRYLPHGKEGALLDEVTVGLDFSWKPTYDIENSKVSRYLTYGLCPVVQLPAPSFRYVPLFGIGQILDYHSSAQQWAEAIEQAATTPLEVKNQLRQAAGNFFCWDNVVFEIASFLQAYLPEFNAASLSGLPLVRQESSSLVHADSVLKDLGEFAMALSPDEYIDRRILEQGVFEPRTVSWLQDHARPGAIVIDVGANNGYMALISRQAVGPQGLVYAIEPTAFGFAKLSHNLSLNHFENIKAYKVAFADECRSRVDITFDPAQYEKGTDHSLRSSWRITESGVVAAHGGVNDTCDFVTLDDFVRTEGLASVDLIKIDVDGHESNVLAGAMKTIEQHLPVLIIEYDWMRNCDSRGQFSAKLRSLIDTLFFLGYEAYAEDGVHFQSTDAFLERLYSLKDHHTSPNFLFKRDASRLLPPTHSRIKELEQKATQCFQVSDFDGCIHAINQISKLVTCESPLVTDLRRQADSRRKALGRPYLFPAGVGQAQSIDGIYGLLSEGDLRALRYCAENSRGNCVNIGVFEGLSTYFLAKTNPELVVYGVDAYLGMHAELAAMNVERMERTKQVLSRLPNAHLIVGLSADIAREWQSDISFLFIDGDHSVRGASLDFDAWSPFVEENGFIAVHDTYGKISPNILQLRAQKDDHGPDVICQRMAESGEYEFVMVSGCTEVWRKKSKATNPAAVGAQRAGRSAVEKAVPAANHATQTITEAAFSTVASPSWPSPSELASGRSLEPFRNRYRGKRAFIIGNGPSLKDLDLTLLKDEFTFGVNSIFYHFDEMGFKPTFYVVEDTLVAEDRAHEINQLSGMVKIYGEYLKYCLADRDDVIWANVHFDYSDYRGFPHFSQDAAEGLWVGGTVTYLCMQLAYFMGFEEVYLLGFDHNYVIPKDAKIEGTVITSSSDDPNHFHPHYFGAGLRWHDPRLDRMELAYRRARQAFEASGRKIYNATAGGNLEVFQRCHYPSLFASSGVARALPSAASSGRTAEQPRISVVVCTHRQPESLDKTLASLFHQVLPRAEYEVIVVDNRSQDSTPDVVAKYPAARYVLEESLGLSFARNAGIQAARSGIVAFIDDDAEADPCWLDGLLRVYDRDPNAWAVGGKVLPIWDAERPVWLTEQYHRSLSLVDWGETERPLQWPERIIGANCSFRKDVFSQIGLFDTCLGRMGKVMLGNEDTEIQQRIHALGYRVMYAPEAVVHHHVPAARMTLEYLEKRSKGTLHSEKILELRANQQHEEAEAYVELLCRAEQAIEGSKEKLRSYKDKHVGQRCVIIGNGPSLKNMDLSFLKDEITFGLNRIYLLKDELDFDPSYFVSINPLVIEQSIKEIEQIPAPKFLSMSGLPYVSDPDQFIFLESLPQRSFSKDPTNGLWEGYTVTYVAMQLAYYMGFSEVILIGVDHHFVTSGAPNREVVSEGEDPNHFHPQYFGSGVRWNLPDLENSEVAYTLAREAYTEAGRQILDATLGGRLTVFPKVDYQRLFEQYREQDQTLPSHYAEVYAKNRRGEELYQAGEREQAMRLFGELLDRVPNYGPTLNNLGVALWEGGDFQQAIRSFYLALKANPEDRTAIINLAEALGCMDVDPQSLTVLQRYSSAHPDDAEVAQLLQEIGR